MEKMTKEQELAGVCESLIIVRAMWKREINSDGIDFNFDSQDIYRDTYKIISSIKLVEEYPPESFSEDRKNIILGLKEICNKMIEMYDKHRSFFTSLKREQLMFDTYRKRNPKFYKVPDFQLEVHLLPNTEAPSKDEYYKSRFYEEYGFLLNDYHHGIYLYCKYLLTVDYSKYSECFKTFIDYSKLSPYFSMGLIASIHHYCNNNQFDEITEFDLYLSLNLMNIISKLKIRKNENKRAFYVLHRLSNLIVDSEVRTYWLHTILNRLDIDYKNYQSKYREVVGSNATDSDKEFVEEINKYI